jgi:hypothetical protein
MKSQFASIFILLVAVTGSAYAQVPGAMGAGALEKVKGLGTPSTKNKITTYYSPGYEKRAKEIQPIIEDAIRFYEKKLGIKMDLGIAILDRAQWVKVAQAPYGLPYVSSAPHVAFLPATGDGVIAADIIKAKPYIGVDTITRLEHLGYTYEEAANKLVDLIGLHELGHTYAAAMGIEPGTPNRWFGEFFASYFAYAYLREKEPKLGQLFEIMTAGSAAIGPKPKFSTLEDFEKLYADVGPANYNWYQGKFMELVVKTYSSAGRGFITKAVSAFKDDNGSKSIDEVIDRLEKITPVFREWSKDKRN